MVSVSLVSLYFSDPIRTQDDADRLLSSLYNDNTIYGSWNFDKNPDNHQPDFYDLDLVVRNYLDFSDNSEIYCLCILCMESFITAPFYFEKLAHLLKTVRIFYHDFRVIYSIRRENRDLKLEFYIIPHELSTGDIYEFSDTQCDQILELSDKILEKQKQDESAASIHRE